MFYPILSSTATTIAAFIPLIFWPGFTGQFMRYLPVTVFIVLTASLVYAMIVTPVIGSIFGQRRSTLYLVKMNKPEKLYLIRFQLFMENGLEHL